MQENKQEKSPIKSRILEYLDCKGVSKYAFYKNSGVSRGILDQDTGIAEDNIARFLVYAQDISHEWLLTGTGSMFRPGMEPIGLMSEEAMAQHDKEVSEGAKRKPILKDDQERVATALQSEYGIPLIPLDAVAGFCSGNSTQVMEYECEKYVVPSFRGAEFLVQVKGSSMYPKYSSGDIVACKCLPLDTFFQWNKVYVVDTDQGVLIKRVRRGSDDDHITLVSENERYEPFVLHKRDIHALAIVIGVIRLE